MARKPTAMHINAAPAAPTSAHPASVSRVAFAASTNPPDQTIAAVSITPSTRWRLAPRVTRGPAAVPAVMLAATTRAAMAPGTPCECHVCATISAPSSGPAIRNHIGLCAAWWFSALAPMWGIGASFPSTIPMRLRYRRRRARNPRCQRRTRDPDRRPDPRPRHGALGRRRRRETHRTLKRERRRARAYFRARAALWYRRRHHPIQQLRQSASQRAVTKHLSEL